MKIIDLRSDTVTRPSTAMRQAMFEAEVGDDVFGDDPTAKELQSYVADLFGKEASLFVPSGTMANQISLKALSEPGWELLCERECHLVHYELAGPAVHSGLMVNLLETESGMITAQKIHDNYRPLNIHIPLTKLVALENTHNRHGGTVLPQNEVIAAGQACGELGLRFHLDGARIWNAHVATGISLAKLAEPFDSISVCLSKGLGAPIGSMVIGSGTFIEDCLRERKLFGGGMRQVGIIAAAGLYAVKNNISRLAEDHDNARLLAQGIDSLGSFGVDLSRVQTNIVVAEIQSDDSAETVLGKLQSVDVLAVPFGPGKIRFVTHLDVNRDDCRQALERIGGLFS